MIPYRYTPAHFFFPLRFAYSELRDIVKRWLDERRDSLSRYDLDADLCGRFAICLEKNGFEQQADCVWKIGSSDRWEDHAHAFAESVVASGDKEAARVAADVVSDCLKRFESRMKSKAVAKVKLEISNLRTAASGKPSCETR
ncbi:hypothetical protein [Planctomyces sp. SH-PL62]|uniref:hypothetical protein n=1 Tax=Planctomyces sp. SH-PL62 TaxID=1636152 RepID=UPI00083929E0|nr:hypothetical protein [Planctomyces sp. SH-PL62]